MTRQLAFTNAELNLESIALYTSQDLRLEVFDYGEEYQVIQGVEWDRVWRFQRIDEQSISYNILGRFEGAVDEEDEAVLRNFLQLDVNLPELYTEWLEDEKFKEVFERNRPKLEGIRILKQAPFDVIFKSVVAVGNSSFPGRINVHVERFCKLYGEKLEIEVDNFPMTFYNFPKYDRLLADLDDLDKRLKEVKIPRHLQMTSIFTQLIENGGLRWLNKLSKKNYRKAHNKLANIKYIADTISERVCLYGFGMGEAVQTTGKLFNVTSVLYLPELPRFKTTVTQYDRKLRKFYLEKFPRYAGWASSILAGREEIQIELEASKNFRRQKKRRHQ